MILSCFMIFYFRYLLNIFITLRNNVKIFSLKKIPFVQGVNQKYKFQLYMILRKHLYLCWLLLIHSKARRLLSFFSFLTAIPLQIYLLYRIMFYRLDFLPLTFSSLLVSSITMYMLIIFLYIARYTQLCHQPAKYLNRIQMSLKRTSLLRCKLRYFYLYERLTLGTYSINFGFQSAITYSFLFKVIILENSLLN